jgi:serine/threonine protein phosphatase PrpC
VADKVKTTPMAGSTTEVIDIGLENSVEVFQFKTKKGMIPNKPDKENQDTYFHIKHFGNIKNNWYFGVCDGHGINGHFASDHVKKNLPSNIELLDFMAMKQKGQELEQQTKMKDKNQFFYEDTD